LIGVQVKSDKSKKKAGIIIRSESVKHPIISGLL